MTWFNLSGDSRIGRCDTEGCGDAPTFRLEAGGIGSNYCSGCRAKIEATTRPPRPALNDPVVDPRNSDEGDEWDAPLVGLVSRFSAALLAKLKAAEAKYGYNNAWMRDGWDATCQEHMIEHLAKGDPLDVAAYCAFMWHHGWATAPATPPQPAVSGEVREAIARIIDPAAKFESIEGVRWSIGDVERRDDARRKADKILALPLIADQSAALAEAAFLLARLEELDDADDSDYVREFEGHVRPSMSRLRAMLAAAPPSPVGEKP